MGPRLADFHPPHVRAFAWWDPRGAGTRFLIALAAGALAVALTPKHWPWFVRAVVVWNVVGLTLTGLAWLIIARANAEETKRRAAAYDPGRSMVWFTGIGASLFSFFAAAFVLRHVKTFDTGAFRLWTLLTLVAIALSWLVTHTSYALRYAHLYYHRGQAGGLEFPGRAAPCDFDFAYFAFTIGMTFQVSDVTISHPLIRREVLFHSLLSFVYNTAILAFALNIAFGLVGS